MKIAVGCDHAGYIIKSAVLDCLKEHKIEAVDVGCDNEASVDYPDYAQKVAQKVLSGECEKGILLCGTGIGISIAANKFKGIRAALCHDEMTGALAAQHNNANILCMGGRVVSQREAKKILDAFLSTAYEPRHQKRLDKITAIENENFH